ncbi:MAG: Asp-tRNA(Asn)/Glu-tRNA(Gln) amidotransferase subunit GatC, partial [Lapillicoccus sp.]
MSTLSRDDVAHLANLARIELDDAELDRMLGELTVILDAVATVQQAPTEGVEPMS